MSHTLVLLAAGIALALPPLSWADPPSPLAPPVPNGPAPPAEPVPSPMPQACLFVGRWRVEFANGVIEACEIRENGTASVAEPRRTSAGKVTVQDGAVVVVYDDDRVERWTPVGWKAVVEHWYPGSAFPSGRPVLGIAKHVR